MLPLPGKPIRPQGPRL